MNIVLIGYGRMGQAVEQQALKRGHRIIAKFDAPEQDFLAVTSLPEADVCIEFTVPSAAKNNCIHCLDLNIPVVSGTTGWGDGVEELRQRAEREAKSFFYASNFSLGVNILFEMNRRLSSIMGNSGGYIPHISETHHIHKLDAPSGTAITLAEGITRMNPQWTGWTLLPEEKENSVPIEALREGDVSGIHEITWSSSIDKLSLRHEAFDRIGFALGAILAAEYSQHHRGALTMEQMLGFTR